jgi:hypothetical protein
MSKLKTNSIRVQQPCIRDEEHTYKIMKGSGKTTGVPLWKCTKCKRKIQSN